MTQLLRGKKFSFQYPSQKVHNCMYLQVQGTWFLLLASKSTALMYRPIKQTNKHNHAMWLNISYFTFVFVCLFVHLCYSATSTTHTWGSEDSYYTCWSQFSLSIKWIPDIRAGLLGLTESTNGCLACLFVWACRPSLIFQCCEHCLN